MTKAEDKARLKKYATQVEKGFNSHVYRNNLFERFAAEFEKAKCFNIGDVVNMKNMGSYYGHDQEFNLYEDDFGNETKIKTKYKIVHKDTRGYFHAQEICGNGSLGRRIFPIHYHLREMFEDGEDLNSKFDFNDMVMIDPDFIDATLLGADYEPLAEYNTLQKEADDKVRADVEAYYKIIENNEKARIPTKYVKERNKFYNEVNIGDKFWTSFDGPPLTLKFKQDRTLVFQCKKEAIAYNLIELKKMKLYTSEPEFPGYIHHNLLKKFKPETDFK